MYTYKYSTIFKLQVDVGTTTWKRIRKKNKEGILLPVEQWKVIKSSTIDITLGTRRIADSIVHWNATFRTSSDHALVTIVLRLET